MTIQDKWMWCNKCQALAFTGTANAGKCPAGGNHTHVGSGNYALAVNDPSIPGQNNWRWCKKCQALSFAGNSKLGQCSGGGDHDHTGSGNYSVLKAESGLSGQSNWRWCNKCQVLSFAGSATPGACAAGGVHDHEGSGNYVLAEVKDCSGLYAQVHELQQQIAAIQNAPGYIQDSKSPHPGKPDDESLKEVQALEKQLAPLAKAYSSCENAKLGLEQQMRLLPGAHNFGPSPFYILGHNTNTIAQVNEALDHGANAVEVDVTAFSNNLNALCIDHAGISGDSPGSPSAPALVDFLHGLRTIADTRPELALVMFDLKPPASRPDLGPKLIGAIRDILTKNSFLPVILSVGDITTEHPDRLIGSTVFDNIAGQYGNRECFMIDAENDTQGVEDFFLKKLKVDHFGFGNGITFGLADEGAMVYRTPIEFACWKRAAHGQPGFVDAWTVNSVGNLALYLGIGVNGMISDNNGITRVRDLLGTPAFAGKYRIARRTDNPMFPDNFEYALTVVTSDIGGAGTNANITFTVTGQNGSASTTWDTNYNARMEQNQTNFVVLHAPDLGPLISVSVQDDQTGNSGDWHLHQIVVLSKRYGVNKSAMFDTLIKTTAKVTRSLV